MKTTFSQSVLIVAIVTGVLLSIPLIAMQFSNEVDWSAADFIVMGALIFGIGFSYVLITRYVTNLVYRIAVAMALGSTFLLIWANLAVGLIGSGPNAANLMYIGVIAVGIVGTILSRFTAGGMERAMYLMAGSLIVIAAILLVTNIYQRTDSSVTEVIAVNSFFAGLFAVAGLLFRYVALEHTNRTENSRS
ncbi:MAG: hypothetical protein HOP08_01510 [Cyclobacteriaceae bacterium]|nr:hypothetical protein [Cyclobacteriaceae bacterium]